MASIKEEKNNTYSIQFRYKNYAGVNCRKHKFNFKSEKEAKEWMEEFIRKEQSDVSMTFQSFYQEYLENQSADLRASTLATKEHIVALHIMPYFKDRKLESITAVDIIKWQNKIKKKGFSDSYLNTIHSQLSAIFNHACRIYNLSTNPCKAAGGMGNKDSGNIGVWTNEEMERFLNAVSDKPVVKYAFFLLYWTGIRLGELLALNIADIDFEKKTLSVTKSLNRIDGKDVISLPKTKSSIRTIYLPQFVMDEMKDYCGMLYGRSAKDRLFVVTKSHLEKEIKRGAELAGLTPIRVHDLRHSHASLLISQGVNVAVISRRLGHKSIKTTLNIYAHMFDKDAKEAADMLDKLYNGEED